jgi:hypothetical protein
VRSDLQRVSQKLGREERAILERNATLVREMEREISEAGRQKLRVAAPVLEPGIGNENDTLPQVSRMQADLLVNAFANDMTRVASLQYTNSVGQSRMRWLGIDDGHHSLSHDPDLNTGSVEKLTKINTWFAEQIAFLAKRLQETPEPDGKGNMLDNTTIVWTNELGKGNSHTHEDIPWVLIGGGLGFKTGRALKFKKEPHNRVLMSIAKGFGHPMKTFGNPTLCEGGQ